MKKSENTEIEERDDTANDISDESADDNLSSADNNDEDNENSDDDDKPSDDVNDLPDDDEKPAGNKTSKPAASAAPAKDIAKNRKAIIFEIALAVLAVIVIVVSIVIIKQKKKDPSGNPQDEISITTGEPGSELAAVDNSILFSTTPDIPEMVQNETLDYEALVAENKMLKLKGSEGQDVYVHNYLNSDYFNKETQLDESEVDKVIVKNILSGYIEPVSVSRNTAEMYDTVSINFVGTMNGVAFEGGTADDQQVTIGVSAYIDGFTEGIVGMKVGETKDVHVTFPKDYGNTDLAGKPAVFAITLNQIISGNKIPELTDDIVNSFTGGELTSAAELRKNIKNNQLAVLIWDFIDSDFYLSSLSDESVKAYYDKIIAQLDASSQQTNTSAEMLINQYYNMDVEAYKKQMMIESVENMRHSILYNAIADKEGIKVSDDDIAKLAAEYGYTDNVDEFVSTYGEDMIHDYILQDNLMEYFISLHN